MKCKCRLLLPPLYPFFVQELLKWQKLPLFKENNPFFSMTRFSRYTLSFTYRLNQSLRATFFLVPTNQIQDEKKKIKILLMTPKTEPPQLITHK